MSVRGLDDPCAACDRVSGDHTLREWAVCMGTQTTDLPWAPVPDDATGAAAGEAIRRMFQLDHDLIVADNVVIKAAVLDGASGPVQVRVPALIHEFGVGRPGEAPATMAKVAFVADSAVMRAYARLAADSARGAARAAEQGR